MAPTKGSRGKSPGLAPPVQRDPSNQKRKRALGWLWGCAAHLQCTGAAIHTALLLTSKTLGHDPSAQPKPQAPQVLAKGPMHLPHPWYFTLPSPLLAFPWMLGPTPPPGPVQAAGTSPREDAGERDVPPPRLAISASRKLVLLGSAPPELQ